MTDIYSSLALYYDNMMDNYDYDQVYEFLLLASQDFSFSLASILEMACGTGRLTEKLIQLGRVDAFDQSEEMLAQAYRRLYKNPRARLFQMDMTHFNMKKKYGAILCLCDSLNYLDSINKIRTCFESVAHSLKEGGVFVFDLNTEYRFKEKYRDLVQVYEEEGAYIVWENQYEPKRKRNLYRLNFFLQEEEGGYDRQIEDHFEYVYDLEEIRACLKQAGLEILSIRNGYTESEDIGKAERISFIVRK